MIRRLLSVLTVTAGAVACSGDSGPVVPSSAAPASASFVGTVASAVSPVPEVTVKTASGAAASGITVTWKVVSGGGTVVNATSTTNASGVATSGGWTLGTTAGTQELEATVGGVSPVRITVQAKPSALSKLVRVAGETQPGVVGQPVTVLPSVRAEDVYSNPIAGENITFSVVSGGGTVTGKTKQTNAQGVATIEGWTLGGSRGQQLLRASGSGGVIATFAAQAAAGEPAAIEVVSGNGQVWYSDAAVPVTPSVRVLDEFGNPVGERTVVFTPGPGSGTVQGGIRSTDAVTGVAAPGAWILGTAPEQSLKATVNGTAGLSVDVLATISPSDFSLALRWANATPTPALLAAVEAARVRWRSIIMANTGVSFASFPAGFCGRSFAPAVEETVSGLLLIASVGTIDGPLGVLANANYCAVHAQSGLPAIGTILIDAADVDYMTQNNLLAAVITHEMGHSVGFHSAKISQSNFGFVTYITPTDPRFTGPQAVSHFLAAGGAPLSSNSVPLQAGANPNSIGGHWREATMTTELMTPNIHVGFAPLSRITIGLLADIGYIVNGQMGDPFTFNTSAMLDAFPAPTIELTDVAPVPGGPKVLPTVRKVPRYN